MAMILPSALIKFIGNLIVQGKIQEVVAGVAASDVVIKSQLDTPVASLTNSIAVVASDLSTLTSVVNTATIGTTLPIAGGGLLTTNPVISINLPLNASDTHTSPSADTHHAGFIGLKKGATSVDPDANDRIEFVEGSNVTITPNSPAAGQITIAASTGGGGSGTVNTVREVDGAPSVASPTILEFHQGDGFVVSNPSGTIAQVRLSPAAHVPFIGLKKGVTNVDPSSERIELVEGSNVTITANSPGAGQITIAAAAGGGGGSVATVREVDGSPSVASPTVLEFDQANGFVVSNPSGTIARVNFADGRKKHLVKAADTVRVNNTVTADPDLQFSVADAEKWFYIVVGNAESSLQAGFRVQAAPNVANVFHVSAYFGDNSTTDAVAKHDEAVVGAATTPFSTSSPTTGIQNFILVGSIWNASGSPVTLSVNWAQTTTTAGTNTALKKGATLIAWKA